MRNSKPTSWVIWFSIAAVWITNPSAQAAAQSQPTGPSYTVQAMLIKNAITAVNHANLTDNYAVLRELTSERFQKQNTSADLAISFQHLREAKLDMSSILVLQPQLRQQPVQDQSGRLHLVGLFPTRPKVVQFGLVFQSVAGGWIIDEIQLSITPTEAVQNFSGNPVPTNARGPQKPRMAARPTSLPQQRGVRR